MPNDETTPERPLPPALAERCLEELEPGEPADVLSDEWWAWWDALPGSHGLGWG